MLTYLLDTNVCIRYLTGRSDRVRERLVATPPEEIAVCSVVAAELFAGARKSRDPNAALDSQHTFLSVFQSLTFDIAAAEAFGRIRSYLEGKGTPIGPYDLQIAAIAVANGLILVTHNTREFSRVPDLRLDDWEA